MEGIQDQEHQVTLQQIRRCIEEELERAGLKVVSIYLFGSRARGQARPDSDWDFLVVVDRPLSGPERRRIMGRVLVALALAGIPADVILLSQPRFLRYKDDVGHIVYYAVREGCMIGLDVNLSPEEHNENLRTHGHDSQSRFAPSRIPAGVCMEP